MKAKKKSASRKKETTQHLVHEAEGAASGAVAGVAVGAAAGPPGMVVGAVIGAVAGAIAASALDTEGERRAEHTRELDDEIGVTSGDMGAANLRHPPATSPAYSVASSGAGTSADDNDPAEGPLPTPKS